MCDETLSFTFFLYFTPFLIGDLFSVNFELILFGNKMTEYDVKRFHFNKSF